MHVHLCVTNRLKKQKWTSLERELDFHFIYSGETQVHTGDSPIPAEGRQISE